MTFNDCKMHINGQLNINNTQLLQREKKRSLVIIAISNTWKVFS